MAYSGTYTFRTNRDEIIKGALRLLGAIDPENNNAPTTNQTTYAAEALNLMVKGLEANGLQLWERKWGVIFPQVGQTVFKLGSPGPSGDHASATSPLGFGFVQTTLDADAASGALTIVVDTVNGTSSPGVPATAITTAYNIGVQLDDGTVQWTTVNGAPSGTTVTLTAALTSAASEGNYVYCYQTKLIRPLRILDVFVRQLSGDNDTPANLISREQYSRFGQKTSTGVPTQIYYDPQRDSGYLYVYPTFSAADQLLYIEFDSPIMDFSTLTDDFDLPQEWGEYLKYGLAYRLAPEYEVSDSKFKQIKVLADEAFDKVDGWDQETTSVFLQPNNVYNS